MSERPSIERPDRPSEPGDQVAERYLAYLRELLGGVDLGSVARVVELLRSARERGATIYAAGNGGSAATATHLVNDLGKATKRGGTAPLRVMSLTDSVSWLTALATDDGYEVDGDTYAAESLPLSRSLSFDGMWFAWAGFYPEVPYVD